MKSIGTKFVLAAGASPWPLPPSSACATWSLARRHTAELTAGQAELALQFDLAIRRYVAEHVRPFAEAHVGDDEFVPEVMSTSFVARSIFEDVRRQFPDYIIKFSSDNPHNPANAAGPEEAEIIDYFRDHPGSHAMDRARWPCREGVPGPLHSAALGAELPPLPRPAGGRAGVAAAQYGATAGFHQTAGDVVALDTVGIPLDRVNAAATAEATTHVLVMALGIVLLFGAVLLTFRLLVGRRLADIARHFRQAAEQDDDAALRPIPVEGRDEIGVLAESYNSLAARLHALHASLDWRVQERTAAAGGRGRRAKRPNRRPRPPTAPRASSWPT